jgi:flagellum-specific peptidoglycan hydrolase FlgJ
MTKLIRIIPALLFALLIFSATFGQAEKQRIEDYINTYKDLAISEMLRSGVPASITLAQGILETAGGQSDLAALAYNHFGIKCKSEWTGETMTHDDDAKNECFRKYPSVEESYKDHSDFLRSRPCYAFLFKLDPTDYEGWAKGLKKAGYATNPA